MRIYEITRRWLLKGAGAASIAAADPTGTLTKIATNIVQAAPASKQDILAELLGTIKPRDLYQIWWGYGEYADTLDFVTPNENNKLTQIYGEDWYTIIHEKAFKEKKSPIDVVMDVLKEKTAYSQVLDVLAKHGLDASNWEQIRDWFFDDNIDKQFFKFWREYKKSDKFQQSLHGPRDNWGSLNTHDTLRTFGSDTVVNPPADELTKYLDSKLSKLKGRVQAAAKRAVQSFLTRGITNKLSKKQLEDIATGNFDMKRLPPQQIPTVPQLEYKPEVYNQWLGKLEANPTVYDPIVIDDRKNVLAGAEQLQALKILDLPAEVYVVSYSDNKEK